MTFALLLRLDEIGLSRPHFIARVRARFGGVAERAAAMPEDPNTTRCEGKDESGRDVQ
jgi:hypothetical protein